MTGQSQWHRLGRRIQVLHTQWLAATSDLTEAQVNHHERDGVLPIAFSLVHTLSVEDRQVSTHVRDEPTEWESGNWALQIGGTIPALRKGTSVETAETVCIGNLAAWNAYQSTVFRRTEEEFTGDADRYDEVLYPDLPDSLSGTSLAIVSGPEGPVHLGDLLEVFVYAHGSRHLGEIEHARSLVGLQGVS